MEWKIIMNINTEIAKMVEFSNKDFKAAVIKNVS